MLNLPKVQRGVISDLLIIATAFLVLAAFSSTVQAVPRTSFVAVWTNRGAFSYKVVNGTQDTLQFSVTEGEASFVCLIHSVGEHPDFCAVGIFKGWDGYHQAYYNTAHYYVDRRKSGSYSWTTLEEAPLQQNHAYKVFIYTGGSNIMFAFIDIVCKYSESGYPSGGYQASGQTETHNTLDQMNAHFYSMTAGPVWLLPNEPFHDTAVYVDPPYQIAPAHPTTTWTATGQGLS